MSRESEDPTQSVVHGIPLAEEIGLGALTLPGFIREVTERFADHEALVQRDPDIRWSYRELWDRSIEVARALVAAGLGKGERVGVLMTNNAEFLATVFGTALAGGVATPLSTFSTPHELDHLLAASACSFLLFERTRAQKRLRAGSVRPGAGHRGRSAWTYCFAEISLLAASDRDRQQHDHRGDRKLGRLSQRGAQTPLAQIEARAETVKPADPGALFFSSGSTNLPRVFSAHTAASPSNFGACDINRG